MSLSANQLVETVTAISHQNTEVLRVINELCSEITAIKLNTEKINEKVTHLESKKSQSKGVSGVNVKDMVASDAGESAIPHFKGINRFFAANLLPGPLDAKKTGLDDYESRNYRKYFSDDCIERLRLQKEAAFEAKRSAGTFKTDSAAMGKFRSMPKEEQAVELLKNMWSAIKDDPEYKDKLEKTVLADHEHYKQLVHTVHPTLFGEKAAKGSKSKTAVVAAGHTVTSAPPPDDAASMLSGL